MDFFSGRYYKVNKFLLTIIGNWPDQSLWSAIFFRGILCILWLSFLITQLAQIYEAGKDWNEISQVLPVLLICLICSVKFSSSALTINIMKEMCLKLSSEWQRKRYKEEEEILHRYTENSRLFTVVYTSYMYAICISQGFLPLIPVFLDRVAPLNATRARKQLFTSEYFIDQEEYFYFISLHIALTSIFGVTVVVSVDCMYIVLIRHACAMFSVVGWKLENFMFKRKGCVRASSIHAKEILDEIVDSIDAHERALKFSELIESCYTWSMLLQLGLSLICMSFILVRMVTAVGNIDETIEYTLMTSGVLLNLLFNSYPGQMLMDHSLDISNKAYNAIWYEMPTKFQRLFLMIIRRGSEPSCVSAGKMVILTLSSFSTVLQTSISYFTVFLSMR
ncbi:odorant receptor 4-like isoform X2 [Prorops nasuta]|uniref:odorant receptor 4-like isoform X2 n=1 Tax=Prorops nasuta TaxID=863751 RepID=UPI0034CD5671